MPFKVEFVGGYMDGEQMTIPELLPEIIFPVPDSRDYVVESVVQNVDIAETYLKYRVYRLDKKKFIDGEFVYFYKFVGIR